ncbi:hypothetical protein L7F22_064648 [Adiantum nelumboides]|nr:hypothetical protein [Adiantum nelumboides]
MLIEATGGNGTSAVGVAGTFLGEHLARLASPVENRKKTTSTRGKGGTTKKTPSSQPVEGTLDSIGSMEDIADVNVTFEEEMETQQEEKELDGQNKEFGDREYDSSKDDDIDDVIPKSINKPQGSEFLESITMNKGMMPPLIPCVVVWSMRRFLMHLLEAKSIQCMPDICKAWTIVSPPTYCMYSSSIFRENGTIYGAILLNDWEHKHCPWWLDMKKGECLEEEKEEYKRHLEGECKSNSGSIGEMDIDQRKRVEEELKALKEKEDQDAQVLVKRGGRPPSTSKVESSMKDKNILGYHSLSQKRLQKMTAFATLALHKNGVSPFINMERGHKVETLLQQDISSQIIGHCMPTLSRAQRDGKSGGWRGILERSASYMLLFMEALCPPMGTVLEIGDGTRPVLKAAMHTRCCCMSIDDDKDICDAYLTPFITDFYGNPRVSKMQDLGVSDSDDDGDFVLNEAPLDYEFPSYAEAMARHMESNPYYDRLLVQHQRSKQCIFIDDEVDFD